MPSWCSILLVICVPLLAMTPPHKGTFPIAALSNGIQLPLVGLGCSSGMKKQHVLSALKVGYRHLDTAMAYQWGYTEHDVGDAVVESGVRRAEILVQSKIHPEDLGYKPTLDAFQVSLTRLRTDYIDSMLIHKPHCWEGACSKQPGGTWQDSWKALEELYDAGKVRAIGICDVDNHIFDELLKQRHKPHIIQNYMDPLHQDKAIRTRCQQEGVQYQAYSTLGTQWVYFRGHEQNPVLTNPTIQSIARAHNCDVAQVIINWATRHGVAVIPASKRQERQESNLKSFQFDLTEDEMAAIDALDGTAQAADPDPHKVSITFSTKASAAFDVFWIGDDGSEVPLGSIPPSGKHSVETYDGHRFIFKQEGRRVGEYTVDGAKGREVHVEL